MPESMLACMLSSLELDLPRLAMQALVDPVPDLLAELLGHAGHPGDHLDGERAGEVLHDVEVVGIGLAQVVLDEFDDGLASAPGWPAA